ncbi:hypothetical protein D3C76_1315190 [compost metagenome]
MLAQNNSHLLSLVEASFLRPLLADRHESDAIEPSFLDGGVQHIQAVSMDQHTPQQNLQPLVTPVLVCSQKLAHAVIIAHCAAVHNQSPRP